MSHAESFICEPDDGTSRRRSR